MGSPVRYPGGHLEGLAPQSSVSRRPPKLATQILSSPSTAIPQGIVSPPPVNGDECTGWPLGLSWVTEAPPGRRVSTFGHGRLMTPEFAIHTFPRLSIATPRGALMPPSVKGDPAS